MPKCITGWLGNSKALWVFLFLGFFLKKIGFWCVHINFKTTISPMPTPYKVFNDLKNIEIAPKLAL